MEPHCWGIGLPRTGTTSLCEALEVLGYTSVGHNPRFEQLPSLDAGADAGVAIFYKYLDHKFPGSKFVLTLRDLDEWLPSVRYVYDRFPAGDNDQAILRRMQLYETVVFDEERFTEGYHRHHEDVRRYFRDRPDDLLELRLTEGEGWDQLCPFLGLTVPAQPFPSSNARGQTDPGAEGKRPGLVGRGVRRLQRGR